MTIESAEYQSLVLPEGHDSFCNCPECHLWHKKEWLVKRNALAFPKDFTCCVDELMEHPQEYIGVR